MQKALPIISKKFLIVIMAVMLVASMILFISPGNIFADYSTFDNPNYIYSIVKSAPDGVFYKQAGISPDGTKILASKEFGASKEIVLMNADGSGESIISPGNSGVGDIYGYMNPFWSDDGAAIGFAEVHNANPNKIVVYDLSTAVRTYIYEPVAPLDVCNPDFLGGSKTTIIFWDIVSSAADLFIWDGTTRTNITNTAGYKEYEPVSNTDGTKIVYWSGETAAEPVNTTHTLTYSGSTWTKDVGFTPIADSYWSTWTTSAANQIALTVMSSKDIHIYDNAGNFVADLTGSSYSGGSGQNNFFGTIAQGPNGEYIITSNAGRTITGRDIVKLTSPVASPTPPPGPAVYTISASASGNGSISNPGVFNISAGAGWVYNITPNAGASITNVIVNGASVGPVSSYTFTGVNSNQTIQAVFSGGSGGIGVLGIDESMIGVLGISNADYSGFVTRCYRSILLREPDASGLSGWVSALSGGLTGEDVASGFVYSTELAQYLTSLDNTGYLNFLYSRVLGRAADLSGLNGWLSDMSGGMTRAEILVYFLNSPEWNTICNAYGVTP